jgi:integrase/recombinase XerD
MELVATTEEFEIRGIAYPGFPLILDRDMNLVPELFDFLIKQCIKRGRVQSVHSWKAYGQSMYDFFSFLEANDNWDWRNINVNRDDTILASYRDWSLGTLGLKASTVNYRLRVITSFYRHALRRGWVNTLPYELEDVMVRQSKGFLVHTDASGGVMASPDVMLKTQQTQINVLSMGQIKQFFASIQNPTQKLIARLAVQTGLRKEELVTFPVKYVQNPQALTSASSHITVELNPSEMHTKGAKTRTIHVPLGLMSALWEYVLHERNQLEKAGDSKQTVLFLNRYGKPYAHGGLSLNKLWGSLGLPFKVFPHILRHTYATHTLYELRKKKNSGVDPLMYVRNRLGHASITTTQKYLHFLDDIEDDLMTDFQNEIDLLSAENN